ncbi:MAG: hypothetical protein WDO16_24250 [Bacteroidota bacterium]
MKLCPKEALLFNGIKFRFAAIDRAFSWAKQNGGSLVAIFLKAENDTTEGYIFPSDLDAAEDLSGNKEAQASHEAIIKSNMQMLQHRAAVEHIELRAILLTDPTGETLLDELGGCECIFACEKIGETATLTVDSINLEKWLADPPVPVELVR